MIARYVPPGMGVDLRDVIDVDERASTQPHELPRVEPFFDRVEPMADCVAIVVCRSDVQEFAVCDDGADRANGDEQHLVAQAQRNALGILMSSRALVGV